MWVKRVLVHVQFRFNVLVSLKNSVYNTLKNTFLGFRYIGFGIRRYVVR